MLDAILDTRRYTLLSTPEIYLSSRNWFDVEPIFCTATDGDLTPFDFAARTDERAPILDFLLQKYTKMVFDREGGFALHAVVRQANFTDQTDGRVVMTEIAKDPVRVELLLTLLEYLVLCIRTQVYFGSPAVDMAFLTSSPINVLRFTVEDEVSNAIQYRDSHGAFPIHVASVKEAVCVFSSRHGVLIYKSSQYGVD